mmetsp:Transcript_675/g.2131  ORF Transcript_675/g.2131 Transcript_675/m.2131 type:complete len:220 (-) Transcript_675:609-1268(-)
MSLGATPFSEKSRTALSSRVPPHLTPRNMSAAFKRSRPRSSRAWVESYLARSSSLGTTGARGCVGAGGASFALDAFFGASWAPLPREGADFFVPGAGSAVVEAALGASAACWSLEGASGSTGADGCSSGTTAMAAETGWNPLGGPKRSVLGVTRRTRTSPSSTELAGKNPGWIAVPPAAARDTPWKADAMALPLSVKATSPLSRSSRQPTVSPVSQARP